jgi:hypothetical protein
MSAHELHESLQHASKIRMGAERMTKDGGEYNQLDNHHRDSDTSTEVDIWDTDGDLNPFLRRRRSIWSRLGSYRWLLDTALLLIIVGLLVEKRWKDGEHKTSRYEIGGDMTGFAPTCKLTQEKTGNSADQTQSRNRSQPSGLIRSLHQKTHSISGVTQPSKPGLTLFLVGLSCIIRCLLH